MKVDNEGGEIGKLPAPVTCLYASRKKLSEGAISNDNAKGQICSSKRGVSGEVIKPKKLGS